MSADGFVLNDNTGLNYVNLTYGPHFAANGLVGITHTPSGDKVDVNEPSITPEFGIEKNESDFNANFTKPPAFKGILCHSYFKATNSGPYKYVSFASTGGQRRFTESWTRPISEWKATKKSVSAPMDSGTKSAVIESESKKRKAMMEAAKKKAPETMLAKKDKKTAKAQPKKG